MEAKRAALQGLNRSLSSEPIEVITFDELFSNLQSKRSELEKRAADLSKKPVEAS